MVRCLLLLAASMALSGCIMGSKMTREEIETSGRRVVQADYDATFQASVNALKSLGFEIAMERSESGTIRTNRRHIRTDAHTTGTTTAQGKHYFRQWRLKVKALDDHAVQITAEPRLFEGDVDISERRIWALGSERSLWNALFDEIESLL